MHYAGLLRDDLTSEQKTDANIQLWKFQEGKKALPKLQKQTPKPGR